MKIIILFPGLFLSFSILLILQACNIENINDFDNGISGNGTIVRSAENFLLNTDSGFQYLTENLSNEL